MVLRRVIPAAAALLGTSAGAAAWYQLFRRPLPRTKGTIKGVAGLEQPLTIERDAKGVPTIKAQTRNDLAFGHGFVHGQDRLFQLELWRRAASGRLSEVLGAEALPADRLMRTLGLSRVASREATELSTHDLGIFAAYAMGVNAAAECAPAPPLEFQLLRIEWEPWGVHHSMAMGKMIALGFSTNMEQELLRADLVRAVGPEKAAWLEPDYPRGNPLVVDPGHAWEGDGAAIAEQIAKVREVLGLSPQPAGSNNWTVAGSRTATGKPLLAGDPHITSSIPSIWHTARFEGAGIEMQGGAFVGFPGLIIGQTKHLAWTFTNAMADVQDLFVEKLRDPGDGCEPEYLFEDEWRPTVVHEESIRVRGREDAEVMKVVETHHGPIVNDVLGGSEYEPLALAWSALRLPFLPLGIKAGEFASGRDAVDAFADYSAPCMNMVWADSTGDIGYKLVGRLPVRRSEVYDLPKPGWTGEHEWDGWVPYEQQAELVNPASGQIVTANNRIAGDDHPHVTSEYLDGWRAARIEQLLGDREGLTLEDFERIQADWFSIPGEATAHRLSRLRPKGQREVRAIERLRSWDHVMSPDGVAPTIYAAFTHHFAKRVSESVIGDSALAERWRSRSEAGFTPFNSAPWRWHPRLIEIWDEGDWDEVALDALSAALDQLEERFGEDSSKWTWGRVHGIRFGHLFGDAEGRPARAFDRLLSRRAAAGGGPETVNAVGYSPYDGEYTGIWGASFRLLADAADPSKSRWMHFTGQSGHPASPHYDDLIADWLAVRSHPFKQPSEQTLELEPQ